MKASDADLSLVAEITDERIDAARFILRQLGRLHSSRIDDTIDHYRRRYGEAVVGAELREALGEDDLAILAPDRAWIRSEDYLALLRSRGNDKIIAWAERSLADKYRRQAFSNVAWNLFFQAENEAKANLPAPEEQVDELGAGL